MYLHHFVDMSKALVERGLVPKEKQREAIEALKSCWTDKIAISWEVDDVIEEAKTMGLKVSREQAINVLWDLLRQHDAEIGINWETIQTSLSLGGFEKDTEGGGE